MTRPRLRWTAVLVALAMSTLACTADQQNKGRQGENAARAVRLPDRLEGWFSRPADPPVTKPAPDPLTSGCELPLEYLKRIRRGYAPGRSHDVVFVPREPNFVGAFDYTSHGGPWDYLQRVPLVFYGPGYIRPRGNIELDREVTVADVAPTIADLLDYEWGADRPGRSVTDALVAEEDRPLPPRVVLTLVWDGGGSDALDAWPDAWPNLRRWMNEGTSVENAIVGSAPSVTPPVHTTIGTAAFPKQHGIVDLTQRMGDDVKDAFVTKTASFSPENMELSTLADDYDVAMQQTPKVGLLGWRGWHLGMMSRGAMHPGGDKDVAVVIDRLDGRLVTNRELYSLPPYMKDVRGLEQASRETDLLDGQADSEWRGQIDLDDPVTVQYTPAWTLFQTKLLKELMRGEGVGADEVPDLYSVNYKQIDDVGHFYNMLSPLMGEILTFSDDALGEIERLLDDVAGPGRWVVAMTADHGVTPEPESVGAWPIDVQQVGEDAARSFGTTRDDLILNERTMGYWLDEAVAAEHDVTPDAFARFLLDYRIEDAVRSGTPLPEAYEGREKEPVFAAAFPGAMLPEIWACAKERAG